MANLFAFRSTDPKNLYKAKDPVGPENNDYLIRLHKESDMTLIAWGNHGSFLNRDKDVLTILNDVYCLGITKSNQPKHPLYIPANEKPILFIK